MMNPERQEYIMGMYQRQRKSNEAATVASNAWMRRKDYLSRYCEANRYTEEQTRQKMTIDWALNDALDRWNWHRREANRCAMAIQTEVTIERFKGVQVAVPLSNGQVPRQRESR